MFDHKPFAYYDVRPVKRVEIRQYTHRVDSGERYSGTFTITFRCYDPFGKLFRNAYTGTCGEAELIQTGILPDAMMPPEPKPSDRQLLIYNCGIERAHTRIQIAGDVGEGLEIENTTTGQRCMIKGLKAGAIPPGAYLEIDSETGQVMLVKGEERELAFHYHDLGYIMLAPSTPFVRSIRVFHAAGFDQVNSNDFFLPHMVGQYLYLCGAWRKIRGIQNGRKAFMATSVPCTGETDTPVVTMNEIWLRGDGIDLSRFKLDYMSRVR